MACYLKQTLPRECLLNKDILILLMYNINISSDRHYLTSGKCICSSITMLYRKNNFETELSSSHWMYDCAVCTSDVNHFILHVGVKQFTLDVHLINLVFVYIEFLQSVIRVTFTHLHVLNFLDYTIFVPVSNQYQVTLYITSRDVGIHDHRQ